MLAAGDVTEADIYSWVALWQKRAGLEQWKIRLRMVHQSELPRGAAAHITWSDGPYGSPGTAEVQILYPAEMASIHHLSPRRWTEHAVVHELMHLVLAPLIEWVPPGADKSHVEDVTDALATMLLERGVPGGASEAGFINAQVSRVSWNKSPGVKKRVMLQIVRAMNAAIEDDVMVIFAQK